MMMIWSINSFWRSETLTDWWKYAVLVCTQRNNFYFDAYLYCCVVQFSIHPRWALVHLRVMMIWSLQSVKSCLFLFEYCEASKQATDIEIIFPFFHAIFTPLRIGASSFGSARSFFTSLSKVAFKGCPIIHVGKRDNLIRKNNKAKQKKITATSRTIISTGVCQRWSQYYAIEIYIYIAIYNGICTMCMVAERNDDDESTCSLWQSPHSMTLTVCVSVVMWYIV